MKRAVVLILIFSLLMPTSIFPPQADGAGLVWRAINKAGSQISDLGDVAGGCTNGKVLQFQASNSTFVCATHGFANIVNLPATTAKILATNSSNKAEFKSLTQGTGITITNGTNAVTITNAGVTSIAGTANNVTMSASTGSVTANLGSNVVITGGSAQTISKAITLSSSTLTNPQINGLEVAITSQSGSYTATSTDDIILMDASAATRTLTLPAAASNTGKIYYIKSIGTPGANIVIVDGNAAETIDGFKNFNMTMADQVAIIQSDGTNWNRLDGTATITRPAGATLNRWIGTAADSTNSATGLSQSGTIRAYPFIVNDNITIDQIKSEITTASTTTTNTCRMGIYRDNGNAYPDALVAGSDVATFDQTVAVKTNTFASPIKLTKGLYWLTYACQTSTTMPTFRNIAVGTIPSVLGYVSTMGANGAGTGWTAAFTYGAFPSAFPAGGTPLAIAAPMILVRVTG
ncbi:MAG: hypothetical protein EB154_09455 [Nitrosopumilaceae archaeon]|nr:hypothetical protein [Nitrososphaerota archaeon]NDF36049.1 hypothetical protein [Nitrosopumilaceae archaeon]